MHEAALVEMQRLLECLPDGDLAVLDVGSLDVNGSYRPHCEGRGWQYTGLDTRAGRNVDTVTDNPYRYPFADGAFDVVISGSTMEHVERPWLWLPELARVLKPGGMLALITHHAFPLHEYPVDCYRYMPHGMRVLLDEAGTLERYEVRMVNDTDISARAWKVIA